MANACDYCEYYIKSCSDEVVAKIFEKVGIESKKEALEKIRDNLDKQRVLIKGNPQNITYDSLLINSIDRFFHKKSLFLNLEPSEEVGNWYKKTKDNYSIEKEKMKNSETISYSVILDVIFNISLMLANTVYAMEEKNKKVMFQVYDLEPRKIRDFFFKPFTKEKIQTKTKNGAATIVLGGAVAVASFALALKTLSFKLVPGCGLAALLLITGGINAEAEKNQELIKLQYEYFVYTILVTWCTMENKKENEGYGW